MYDQKLPNAIVVLVLGIASVLTCCFYGFGIFFAGIGIYLASKDIKLYQMNPKNYGNYPTLNIGRILCWIGLIINLLTIVLVIYAFNTIGWDALNNPELLQERIKEMQELQNQ